MFLFESSKQKAIRQDVEKSMETCISNPKKYNEAKDILVAHLRSSQQKIIEMIVDNIKATIKNEDFQPIRKYQAILLLKDIMQTQNKALGKYVVKKMLKRLTILAQHKGKESQREDERGKDIFGQVKKDQEQYSVKFLNTLLTALQQWGKNWPKAPDGPYTDFHRQYNDLLMNGVQFPKQRPKQLRQSTGISGNKLPNRQQMRSSSVNEQSKSQPKTKTQVNPPTPKPKQKVSKNSSKTNLRTDLDKFYENTKQPLELLSSMLSECGAEQLPIIVDIIGQIEKNIEKGNQFVVQIQGIAQYAIDNQKIAKGFQYLSRIQKDLKILSKKPQQITVFKNKYTKQTNQLIQFLKKSNQQPRSETPPAIPPAPLVRVTQPPSTISQVKQVKVQQPKIKIQNRYTSVQPHQVIQNFNKNDFQSHSGQSVNSERFGSFGGPNTERHRASIPVQQGGSPQLDKNKPKQGSDRKTQQKEKKKQISIIAEEQTMQINNNTGGKKNENKSTEIKPKKEQIPKQFEEFPKYEQNLKNTVSAFEGNNSFGGQKFAPQGNNEFQQGFFAKIEAQPNQDPSKKKKPQQKQSQDFFSSKIQNQVDSSQLSAFQFSQKAVPATKNNIKSVPPKQQPTSSKKGFDENPFGLDTSQHRQKQQPPNFFDNLNPNKSYGQDLFGKSTVTQKVKTQYQQNQQVQVQFKMPLDNPFGTGNFGNMIEQPNTPVQNPFDKQSYKSKQSSSKNNPFGNQSFDKVSKISKKSKQNKVLAQKTLKKEEQKPKKMDNPFQSKVLDSSNFFDSKLNASGNAVNPFQTSMHKSQKSNLNPFDQLEEFYKPQKKPSVQPERNSLKDSANNKKPNDLGLSNFGFGEPIRDSLQLSAKFDNKVQENGLNFSQFDDIQAPNKQNKQIRNSNPFGEQDHQFSGFSLSNFPPLPDLKPSNSQKKSQLNGSNNDFFAQFQKESVHSKKSKPNEIRNKQQAQQQSKSNVQKETKGPQTAQKEAFQVFNLRKSQSNGQKSENRKSITQNHLNYDIQREKTVLSGEDKSYDFTQLQKISAIQRKGKKQNDFDNFTEYRQNQQNTKRSVKQGFIIDNKSQKQLSWGDFDQQSPKQKNVSRDYNNEVKSNKSLEVQSRVKIDPQQPQKQSKPTSRVIINAKLSNQNSLQLNIQDFAPVSKKGIEWNPLAKLPNLKPAFIYNVDDRKIQVKKQQLLDKQKEYNEQMQMFRKAREDNQKIRNMYLDKMKKVEQVIHQKAEYQQILKKIKDTNNSKQTQIEEIYKKIKKATQLKDKILQKQKQFYQITKNEASRLEKKANPQRSMANKWQMFNKSLEINRNSMYTAQSQYTNGY